MPNCKVCGKSVSCGLVICSEECFSNILIEVDDVEYNILTAIVYYKNGPVMVSWTTIQSHFTTERKIVDNMKAVTGHKAVDSIYFIETKKLIKIER
jgi:hypothetical protein